MHARVCRGALLTFCVLCPLHVCLCDFVSLHACSLILCVYLHAFLSSYRSIIRSISLSPFLPPSVSVCPSVCHVCLFFLPSVLSFVLSIPFFLSFVKLSGLFCLLLSHVLSIGPVCFSALLPLSPLPSLSSFFFP